MPRRSRSRSGKSSSKPSRNPPQYAAFSPPRASTKPKSEGSSLANGFKWGVGMYVGHRIMKGIFGGEKNVISAAPYLNSAQSMNNINKLDSDVCAGQTNAFQEIVVSSTPDLNSAQSTYNINKLGSDVCVGQTKAFLECVDSNENEISKCQMYMKMLSECRRNSASPPQMD